MSGGLLEFPRVVRTQIGAGQSSGAQHSQSLEAIVAHVPGLKVVMPATVEDAYDLMRASIRDRGPVVYIENRRLYGQKGSLTPAGHVPLPIGRARIARGGDDVTRVTWSRMAEASLEAAGSLP